MKPDRPKQRIRHMGRKPKPPARVPNNRSTANRRAARARPAATRLETIITMLRDPKGATIEALMKATGWQSHSIRGAISGAIKKKLGLKIASEKPGSVRIYRITD